MSPRPSLIRDMSHYVSGRLLLVALSFATFPIMLRVLTVSHYGIISLVLRVVLLLTVLSKCGLQYSAGRFYKDRASAGTLLEQRQFCSTLIFGPLLTSAAVLFVYVPALVLLRGRIADPVLYHCLQLAPALVVIRTMQSLLLSLLRNEGRSRLHSILEVVSKLLTLGALLVLLAGRISDAFHVMVAITATESVVVIFQLATLSRRKLLNLHMVEWSLVRTALAFGAPLIAYELSSIVLDSGDRLMVRHYLGDQSLGLYSAAYNIAGSLQETVMTPLNLAIFPVYMRLWNTEGREATTRFLSTSLTWFTAIALALAGLCALCSREMVVLLASPRFAESSNLMRIIVPALLLYATHIFLNVGLILEKRTGLMALLVFVSAIMNLGLNVVLIPRFGLIGAAWATLLAYGLLVGSLAVVNQRLLPLKPQLGVITAAIAAATLAFALASRIHIALLPASLAAHIGTDLSVFCAVLLLLSKSARAAAAPVLLRFPVGKTSRHMQEADIAPDTRIPSAAETAGTT